jgi:hypothetical protein
MPQRARRHGLSAARGMEPLWSPAVATSGKRGGRHRGCALDEFPQYSVAFLVIRNRGHRNAAAISVGVKHLRLSAAVPIRETLGGGDD